jgi:hypothetical protein
VPEASGRNRSGWEELQEKTWETGTAERRQDNMGEDWCTKEEAIPKRAGRQEQQREDRSIKEKEGQAQRRDKRKD